MDFLVVGKRVMIVDRNMKHPGTLPATQRREYLTHTVISCPPRSLRGPGSELMGDTPDIGTLMELETKSTGGLLRALSGALVWRTAGDFSRLALEVARTKFADGRLIWEVLPQLTIAPGEPIAQLIEAKGKLTKLTNRMLTDIRDYVKRLVEAAERNELPLCLLRHLLSFLGSPPGGASEPQRAPRHPPTAVWRTMTRLRELRLGPGLGGHGKKRHHTSQCAEVPVMTPSTVQRPWRRRHSSALPVLRGVLVSSEEQQPLPGGADHPLDLHMADRTVRFCSRPAAALWEGSEFSLRWRRELATQQRCRIVGRVTLYSHTRHHLRQETSQRCLKHDIKWLLWKKAQEHQKLIREHQLQRQQQQEEESQKLPYPYPQGSRILKFLGISSTPYTLGNNMLVFPPPLKERKRSAAAQRRQPKFKFGPSQRPSMKQAKPSHSLQGPQHQVVTTTALVHHSDVDDKQRSPAASASKPSHHKIDQRPSSVQQASPLSRRVPRRPGRQAAPGGSSNGDHRTLPTLEDYRFALLRQHFSAIRQGRRRRQNAEKPLPPRSPLAGPALQAEEPPSSQPPASDGQQAPRPGLWLRLMSSAPAYLQDTTYSPPQIKERRSSPPLIQKTYPTLSSTQKTRTGYSSPQTLADRPSPPQMEVQITTVEVHGKRPSPSRIQGKRPSPPQAQNGWPSPVMTQRARSTPLRTPQKTTRSPNTPPPSLWNRMTDRLGIARSPSSPEEVEVGQEATEARVRAIVQYQSTLPPLLRVRLLEGGC